MIKNWVKKNIQRYIKKHIVDNSLNITDIPTVPHISTYDYRMTPPIYNAIYIS